MADQSQDSEEYQFTDPDDSIDESSTVSQAGADTTVPAASNLAMDTSQRVRVIVIGVISIVVLVVLYKLIVAVFHGKKEVIQPVAPPAITQAQPFVTTPTPQPADAKVMQTLSELDASQQNTQTEISNLNNQLSGVTGQLNDLSAKISALNQIVVTLGDKVDQQSQQIVQVMERTKPKIVRRVTPNKLPSQHYTMQAVIPGRAWLIAKDGSTLTVREGTIIAGYGIVQRIDPMQGAVFTSSGRMIRFSQEDS